jgi:hypothetical protein
LTPQGNKPKLASGPKSIYTRSRVFVIAPLAAESLQKNPFPYDALASGATVYAYVDGNPMSEIDPLGLWGWGDPINPTVANSITGFGDAFLIPILTRAVFNYGTVDQCSTAYKNGEIVGTVWGLIPIGLEEAALAADRTILNSNRYFRIGMGRWGKDMVPRISSPYLPGDGHVILTSRIPALPPVGEAASPSCGCR